MTSYKCLLYEVKDAVATLTLNRPERLNALGDTLRDDLQDAVTRASADRRGARGHRHGRRDGASARAATSRR